MSNDWVGPGWWMASDGKWYPPRSSSNTEDVDDMPPTRWRRPTSDAHQFEEPEPMSLSEKQAALLAERAERAARIAPTSRFSIATDPSDVADQAATVEIPRLDDVGAEPTVEAPELIDLTAAEEVLDLRASAEPDPVPSSTSATPKFTMTKAEDVFGSQASGGVASNSDAMPMPPPVPASALSAAGSDASLDAKEGSLAGDKDEAQFPEVPEDETSDVEDVGEEPPALQHAVLPALVENEPPRSRAAMLLLVAAVALAVTSGLLGSLWLRERSNAVELRDQLAQAQATDDVTAQGLDSLNDEVRTLRLQNQQLEQRLTEATALVLELPEGRVTEVSVPFTPAFADEENGRLIAFSESGEFIVWGEGPDGPVTNSGDIGATPTGLFAAARKAWVSTDAGRIEVLSMVPNEPGLPAVEFEPTAFLAAEERGYWTFVPSTGEVVRLKKSDGSSTAGVALPVPVVDLTIGAGSVWALGNDGRVYRINTADLTVQPLDAGEDLIGVTAGPDALWTLSAADGSLRRVDPVTGDVLVTVPVGRDPVDAVFAGDSVWVALRAGASLIEVDTRTSAVVSRTALPGEPIALHQGDSGVFVATEGDVRLLRVASLAAEVDAVDDDAASADEAADE